MAARKRCLELGFLEMRIYMSLEGIFPRPGAKPPFMREPTIAYANKAD